MNQILFWIYFAIGFVYMVIYITIMMNFLLENTFTDFPGGDILLVVGAALPVMVIAVIGAALWPVTVATKIINKMLSWINHLLRW